jgi:hypothetical protein
MTAFDLHGVGICPWALREGIVCRRMAMTPLVVTDDLKGIIETRPRLVAVDS